MHSRRHEIKLIVFSRFFGASVGPEIAIPPSNPSQSISFQGYTGLKRDSRARSRAASAAACVRILGQLIGGKIQQPTALNNVAPPHPATNSMLRTGHPSCAPWANRPDIEGVLEVTHRRGDTKFVQCPKFSYHSRRAWGGGRGVGQSSPVTTGFHLRKLVAMEMEPG